MENMAYWQGDLDDLVFEHRNQAYGAYSLRKTYGNHIKTASVWGIVVFAAVISGPSVMNYLTPKKTTFIAETVVLSEISDKKTEKKPELPPPPKPKETIKKIATTRFLPPQVTEEVETEPPMPPMDDIKTAVSDRTQEGDVADLPPVAPPDDPAPAPKGDGDGQREEPKIVPIFTVEQQPEFPNGLAAMYKFLSENVHYPSVARDNGIEGMVYLSFVVWTDGSIRNVEVKRGLAGGLSEEAVRVVKLMPNWKPAKQNGKAVPVVFTLPIRFELEH